MTIPAHGTWSRALPGLHVPLQTAAARRQLRAALRCSPFDADGALRSAERAAQRLQHLQALPHGPGAEEVVAALHLIADLQVAQGAAVDAIATLDRAETIAAAVPDGPRRRSLLANTLIRRGDARRLQAQYGDAHADLAAALRLGDEPVDRVHALNAAGILCKDTGQLDRAAGCYAAATALLEAHLAPDHPVRPTLLHNLAGLDHARGRYADAEAHIRQALGLGQRRHRPPGDPDTLADLGVLAAILAAQGRHDEAEVLFHQLLQGWIALRGPHHYEVACCQHHLGALCERQGDAAGALAHLRSAVEGKRRSLGSSHPEVRELEQDIHRISGLPVSGDDEVARTPRSAAAPA